MFSLVSKKISSFKTVYWIGKAIIFWFIPAAANVENQAIYGLWWCFQLAVSNLEKIERIWHVGLRIATRTHRCVPWKAIEETYGVPSFTEFINFLATTRCHSESMKGRSTFALWCVKQMEQEQAGKKRVRWNRQSTSEKTEQSVNRALGKKYKLFPIGNLAKNQSAQLSAAFKFLNFRQKFKEKMLPRLLAKNTITQTASDQLNEKYDRGYIRKR